MLYYHLADALIDCLKFPFPSLVTSRSFPKQSNIVETRGYRSTASQETAKETANQTTTAGLAKSNFLQFYASPPPHLPLTPRSKSLSHPVGPRPRPPERCVLFALSVSRACTGTPLPGNPSFCGSNSGRIPLLCPGACWWSRGSRVLVPGRTGTGGLSNLLLALDFAIARRYSNSLSGRLAHDSCGADAA